MEEFFLHAYEYCSILLKQISYTTVLAVLAFILHVLNMRQAVAIALPFVLMSTLCLEDKVVVSSDSRFEYEYKVLQKLVQLEEAQAKLEIKLKEKSNIIEHLTEELKESRASIEALNDVVDLMEAEGPGQGETYVRWGRTTCPDNGAELLYAGYTGGSHHTHSGAAVNYLCLPKDPLWSTYKDGLQDNRALVYGAEYETSDHYPQVQNHDPPCAVCKTPRAPVRMIPGRNECYKGWTLEYKGKLVAGYYNHAAASEFVCLDESPESIIGSQADQNGKLFYFAEGRCGSLKCPPYVDGRELSCAVCSYISYQRSRDNPKRHWTGGK